MAKYGVLIVRVDYGEARLYIDEAADDSTLFYAWTDGSMGDQANRYKAFCWSADKIPTEEGYAKAGRLTVPHAIDLQTLKTIQIEGAEYAVRN